MTNQTREQMERATNTIHFTCFACHQHFPVTAVHFNVERMHYTKRITTFTICEECAGKPVVLKS